jgi:hypothetical protein
VLVRTDQFGCGGLQLGSEASHPVRLIASIGRPPYAFAHHPRPLRVELGLQVEVAVGQRHKKETIGTQNGLRHNDNFHKSRSEWQ